MALAAVLAIDCRGPVLAEVALATTGRVALADGGLWGLRDHAVTSVAIDLAGDQGTAAAAVTS